MPPTPFDPHRPVVRWTTWRKQMILEALDQGRLTVDDIGRVHNIGPDELAEWRRRNGSGGETGRRRLRTLDRTALAERPVTAPPPDRRLRKHRLRRPAPSGPASHGGG